MYIVYFAKLLLFCTRECKKFICLDKRLDKKAKKNNMTSKQGNIYLCLMIITNLLLYILVIGSELFTVYIKCI